MKSFILSCTLILTITLTVSAQKLQLELSFTSGYHGLFVPLDSIRIENPRQSCDTILFYPDTTLLLDMIIGIHRQQGAGKVSFELEQNHPNPFSHQTCFHLFLPEREWVEITAFDPQGKEVIQHSYYLSSGLHSFLFQAGDQSLYLLSAMTGSERKTIRMINLSGFSGNACSLLYTGEVRIPGPQKSGSGSGGFIYLQGDTLIYTGYAQPPSTLQGSDVIRDAPQENKSYECSIQEGT